MHPGSGPPAHLEPGREHLRHRTLRTKDALSQKTAKLMVFTLVRAASKTWRKLNGTNRLPSVIEGVTFTDRGATQSRTAGRGRITRIQPWLSPG